MKNTPSRLIGGVFFLLAAFSAFLALFINGGIAGPEANPARGVARSEVPVLDFDLATKEAETDDPFDTYRKHISAADHQIGLLRGRMKAYEREVKKQAERLAQLDTQSNALLEVLKRHERRASALTRTLWEVQKRTSSLFPAAAPPARMARKMHILTALLDAQRQQMHARRQELDQLHEKRDGVAALIAEQRRIRKATSERMGRYARSRDAAQEKLTVLRSAGRQPSRTTSQERIAAPRSADAFFAQKGALPLPVAKVLMVSAQDDPEGGRKLLLRASVDEPLLAPFAGKIVYARNLPPLGPLIVQDMGSDHFFVYTGLKNFLVAEGSYVPRGTPIATLSAAEDEKQTALLGIALYAKRQPVDTSAWFRTRIAQLDDGK